MSDRHPLLLLLAFGAGAMLSATALAAQDSSLDGWAKAHGYASEKAWYCHTYGEAPHKGDTCPAEYLSKPAPPQGAKGDACGTAWALCWNAARRSGNMARQAQCTAERTRCNARLHR